MGPKITVTVESGGRRTIVQVNGEEEQQRVDPEVAQVIRDAEVQAEQDAQYREVSMTNSERERAVQDALADYYRRQAEDEGNRN